jgi:2-oxoglutarate ferredoxin oxidoreductase subunit gamma
MNDNRYEIRLSGSGGQGLILAGIILAEAASIYDGKEAVQTQSYGPESRGGASKSEVVISDQEIDYPKVTSPDLLLAMTQEACDKYVGDLKEGGVALLDSFYVERTPEGVEGVHLLPLTTIAKDGIGKVIVANIVALGAIVALSKVVSKESAEKAILDRVPKGTEEMNLRAFNAGFEAVGKL